MSIAAAIHFMNIKKKESNSDDYIGANASHPYAVMKMDSRLAFGMARPARGMIKTFASWRLCGRVN